MKPMRVVCFFFELRMDFVTPEQADFIVLYAYKLF